MAGSGIIRAESGTAITNRPWAVVDYYRRPKLGYSALQSSMQPSIEYQIDDPCK